MSIRNAANGFAKKYQVLATMVLGFSTGSPQEGEALFGLIKNVVPPAAGLHSTAGFNGFNCTLAAKLIELATGYWGLFLPGPQLEIALKLLKERGFYLS